MKLYTTPLSVHVDDVTLVTSLLANGSVDLSYVVDVFASDSGPVELQIILKEKEGGSVVSASLQLPGCQKSPCVLTGNGQLLVNNPRLWWPWTMEPNDPGYLYQLEVGASCTVWVTLLRMWFNKENGYNPVKRLRKDQLSVVIFGFLQMDQMTPVTPANLSSA